MNPDFYKRFMIGDVKVDYYLIAMLYEVNDPCISHILKKALRCGRSHKSIYQDVQDIIDTAKRWQTLNPNPDSQPMVAVGNQESLADELHAAMTRIKEVIPEYTVQYLPTMPTWWNGEVDMWDTWSGPGWYIIQYTPFSVVLGGVRYLLRELALAHANFEDFAIALRDGRYIGTIEMPVNKT